MSAGDAQLRFGTADRGNAVDQRLVRRVEIKLQKVLHADAADEDRGVFKLLRKEVL